jgi:hypothetical protein
MKKLLKIFVITVGVSFLSFLVYSNWSPKPLHASAPEIDFLLIEVKNEDKQIENFFIKLRALDGVSTCSYSEKSKHLSIIFFPDIINRPSLIELLRVNDITYNFPQFEGESGPQCPIPHTYLMKFEKAKYAFNFR